jgi:serine/threonine protein kinase
MKLDGFQMVQTPIGSGSFGQVHAYQKGSVRVAVKFIKSRGKIGLCPSAIREVVFLRRLKHPGIVEIIGFDLTIKGSSMALVMPYYPMNLRSYIQYMQALQFRGVCSQLVDALNHCHELGVIHRDVKPSNILVFHQGGIPRVKLGDFGMAADVNSSVTLSQHVVTCFYRPPELLIGSRKYGFSVDSWSAGCVFAEILSTKKKPVFAQPNPKSAKMQLDMITRKLPGLLKSLNKAIKMTTRTSGTEPIIRCVIGMLQLSPSARWTMRRCGEELAKS